MLDHRSPSSPSPRPIPVGGLDNGRGLARDPATSRIIGGFLALGFSLRVGTYLLDLPLWWDEAFVAVNLLRRDFVDLLRPLDYGQVCPILFLWGELIAVRVLGFSEWSLRLFPLLCALASLALFRVAAGQILEGRARLQAIAIFAVAYHPIRHAADVKPYASDLLVALILQMLAVAWLKRPARPGGPWCLVLFVPFALLLSHPAAFVVGGVGLVLASQFVVTRDSRVRILILAYAATSFASYAAIYALFTRAQASSASPGMRQMWTNSFPPLNSVAELASWLAVAHTGDMMAYPCGGERGLSGLSFLACVVGATALWRRGQRAELACLLAPLGVALVAAGFRLYPYGGPAPHGSSARVMQYAAPAFCLLIGLGGSRVLDCVASVTARDRLSRLGCWALIAVGVIPWAGQALRPYRAYQAEAARRFAREFWPVVGRGAEVACLRWDCDVGDWDSIQLGIAVSLCNQAIYSPSRRDGGPDWRAVSPGRPLRCVLGVGPEADDPRLLAWLESMGEDYRLRRRERIFVDLAPPGRAPDRERYDVFEFVPGDGAGSLTSSPPTRRVADEKARRYGSRPASTR